MQHSTLQIATWQRKRKIKTEEVFCLLSNIWSLNLREGHPLNKTKSKRTFRSHGKCQRYRKRGGAGRNEKWFEKRWFDASNEVKGDGSRRPAMKGLTGGHIHYSGHFLLEILSNCLSTDIPSSCVCQREKVVKAVRESLGDDGMCWYISKVVFQGIFGRCCKWVGVEFDGAFV